MSNLNEGEQEFVQKLRDAGYPQMAALIEIGLTAYWPRRYDVMALVIEWDRILRLAGKEGAKR